MPLREQVLRILAARDAVVRLRSRVEADPRRPTDSNAEHDWAPVEILAHCAEMLPYWLGEVERVLDGWPEPVPFGRVATDPIRTLTVDRDRSLPPATLYEKLGAGVDRVSVRLLELDDRQAAKRGLHPSRGEMPVTEIVERFLVGHLEEHAAQLAETLGEAPA
ncbi:MAG TPA: DinB family protein [Candidatus Limnocylindrales bacterium]